MCLKKTIEEIASSIVDSMGAMDLRTIQPFLLFDAFPAYATEYFSIMGENFEALPVCGKDAGFLFPNLGALRLLIFFESIKLGLVKEKKVKRKGQRILSFLVEAISRITPDVPGKNGNHYFTSYPLPKPDHDQDKLFLRSLKQLQVALLAYSYALWTDNFPQISYSYDGPFVSNEFLVVVKRFSFLRGVWFEPITNDAPVQGAVFFEFYKKDARVVIDPATHFYSSSYPYYICASIDGKWITNQGAVDALINKFTELTGKIYERMSNSDKEHVYFRFLAAERFNYCLLFQRAGICLDPERSLVDALTKKGLTSEWMRDIERSDKSSWIKLASKSMDV